VARKQGPSVAARHLLRLGHYRRPSEAIILKLGNLVPPLSNVQAIFRGEGVKVLVAYASKYGSTKGIAVFIGEKLREQGMQVDIQEVGAIRNVTDYEAFVIGSAVYMFHWLKEARQFIAKNRTLLVNRPVWLFSSGPVGTQTKDSKGRDVRDVSGPKEIDELRDAVRPRDHRVFFGALEATRLTGTIGFAYRLARRSQAAREAMPEGDFRDWKEIESWVIEIAEALGAPARASESERV
jgi:menaquinone-dependent protoporphyrinogen oxidase